MAPMSVKGNVVLVPFPFDDLSTTKVRPAVCLTSPVSQRWEAWVATLLQQLYGDGEPGLFARLEQVWHFIA